MKLYVNPMSPNSRKALLAAHDLGIPVEAQVVDLVKGETKTPAYLKMNPNGMVPTLDDDGFVLWESNAIMQYMASTKPGNALLPDEPKARADVLRWQSWELAHWDPACGTLIWENMLKQAFGAGAADPVAVKAGEEKFHRFARILDARLAGREWVVGAAPTLADYSLASYLMYAQPAKMPLDSYSDIKRWLGNVEKREAWKATQPRMPA